MSKPRNESRWTGAELDLIEENPDLDSRSLAALLPGRTSQAVGNVRSAHFGHRPGVPDEKPVVKAPGQYVETLATFFTEEFELMEIWAKWNGYSSYRIICTTNLGWSTVLCEAKG